MPPNNSRSLIYLSCISADPFASSQIWQGIQAVPNQARILTCKRFLIPWLDNMRDGRLVEDACYRASRSWSWCRWPFRWRKHDARPVDSSTYPAHVPWSVVGHRRRNNNRWTSDWWRHYPDHRLAVVFLHQPPYWWRYPVIDLLHLLRDA